MSDRIAEIRAPLESEVWRAVAERFAESPDAGLYGLLADQAPSRARTAARFRLNEYDGDIWEWQKGDEYEVMNAEDMMIAALWLALEAESEPIGDEVSGQ